VLYLDPRPESSQSALVRDTHTDGYYSLPAAHRLAWLRSVRPQGRLLEVGCGPGHLLAKAREAGFEVTGVDANPSCARRARDERSLEVEARLIEESSLPEESFDLVFHVDLLSHFPDPEKALSAMVAKVRPGGRLCFEVGIMAAMSPRWYRWVGRLGFPEHRWFYSMEAVETLLHRVGYQVESVRRYGLLPSLLLIRLKLVLWPLAGLFVAKPSTTDGTPPEARGVHRLYDRLLLFLRYGVGRLAPPLGPQTVLVSAKAAGE